MSALLYCCPPCDEQLKWIYESALVVDHEPGTRALRQRTVILILKNKLLDCVGN